MYTRGSLRIELRDKFFRIKEIPGRLGNRQNNGRDKLGPFLAFGGEGTRWACGRLLKNCRQTGSSNDRRRGRCGKDGWCFLGSCTGCHAKLGRRGSKSKWGNGWKFRGKCILIHLWRTKSGEVNLSNVQGCSLRNPYVCIYLEVTLQGAR